MTVDRLALANAVLPTLTATGHLVDVAQTPAGGGDGPAGHTPYTILWPQPTIYIPMMSDAHTGDTTVMQLSTFADDPDLAMRVSDDLKRAVLALPELLAGRHLVQVRIRLDSGPLRDPDDRRLHMCVVQPAVETFPA